MMRILSEAGEWLDRHPNTCLVLLALTVLVGGSL